MVITTFMVILGVIGVLYVFQHYKCDVVEYQNLSGPHSERVCTWEK